jgi:hypothetical protein
MAALGAYHGLNPAMGWLFAVSLGMQERSRAAVVRALGPIAIGHELSLLVVAALVLGLGLLTDPGVLHVGSGIALIAFGVFRFVRPRAHPRWTRMRVSRRELGLWSFLMASAHGAGLMVAPVLIGAGTGDAVASSHGLAEAHEAGFSVPAAAVGLVLHVGAMVAVAGTVALLVYTRFGVGVLRRWWVNTDAGWAVAFVLTGTLTLFT